MKYLKKFEGFEYNGPQYAKNICDGWGVDLEDIEDLFIEFADEGEVLIHPMIVNKELKVTVHSIWKDLNDSDWLYNPLWDERFNSIKRILKQIGLNINLETKKSGNFKNCNNNKTKILEIKLNSNLKNEEKIIDKTDNKGTPDTLKLKTFKPEENPNNE